MSYYTIVTVSTGKPREDYYTYDQFFKSLNRYGEKPLVLSPEDGTWKGLGSKVKMLHQAIKQNLIKTKYIIFSDCYDVVFARPIKELFMRYRYFNSPFVISAEKNCFPDDLKTDYDKYPPQTSYKYLNSGMIVGETGAILTVLEDILPDVFDDYPTDKGNVHCNDQFLYQQSYLRQPVKMSMDVNQILCNTLHSVKKDDLDFLGSVIQNKETKSIPCAFHFNGNAKTEGPRKEILDFLKL